MLRSFFKAIAALALLAAAVSPTALAGGASGELCALPTASLEAAVSQHADSAFAIEEVKKHAIATWYTDRTSVEASQQVVRDITKHCDDDSRMTLVVYGLPAKDCDAGYSTGGFNQNANDYKQWLQTLVDGVGQRKVLYVVEPDAVGLLAKGGCGVTKGYEANMKMALEMLTKNPNADVYLDLGYWTLFSPSDASGVAKTVKALAQAGRLKGIALNTSNYRSSKQMSELCGNFQKAYGDNSLHCIVDTSRNYNENPPSSEWCNARFGGVGRPPSSTTGYENLDYFIWIKPAGESDGSCQGGEHNTDAMQGPAAGAFFKEHFVQLWNNGYFVKEKNLPAIDGSVRPTTAPSSAPTPVPSKPDQYAPVPSSAPTPVPSKPDPQSPVTDAPTAPFPNATTATPISDTTSGPAETQSPEATTSMPTPSSGQVDQYSAKPSLESHEIVEPASTPAVTHKKKKRSGKKCDSGLEPSSDDGEDAAAVVKAADDVKMPNVSSKSVSFAALENDVRAAPATAIGSIGADDAVTKTAGVASSGLPGGAIAAIVVVGVIAVAVGAVALRRRGQPHAADAARPSLDTFNQISVTPAGITVL